jgi:melibiose permease
MIPAFTESGKEREGLTTLARSCAGVGSAIVTIITMMCVYALGNNNERVGFKYFAIVIAVVFIIFITITCINIKEKSTVNVESPSVGQMFKALVQNDQAMAVVVAIVLINCSIYITSNLVLYFFKYDFGGTGWGDSYTLFNIFGGGIQILSMMIFYPVMRRFLSNVRIFYVCLASAITGYVVLFLIAFINMSSVVILFIPAFFIFAANGVLQVITTIFLANTVDYGELKNSRRDESVIFSMQTFVVKLASCIAAFIASICLQINKLQGGGADTSEKIDYSLAVSASSKLGLRMTMTIIPVAGLIVAIYIFAKKYILTDSKLSEISKELDARR